MKGIVLNIESTAANGTDFRRVLYTAKGCQLVIMAVPPKGEIGVESHEVDQFFRIEQGTGEVVIDGTRTPVRDGFAMLVPAGATHNIVNTGDVPLKLYTLYAPAHHRDGVIHHTAKDASEDSEHFDGATTE